MRTRVLSFLSILFLTLFFAHDVPGQTAQLFTSKRTKRGPSIGTLKESCCELLGDYLSESAKLLSSLSGLQSKSLAAIEGYVKSDKSSWCETASREKLALCQNKLLEVNKKLVEFRIACDEAAKAMQIEGK